MPPDYLLLTDADIVHGSGNLRRLVARCEAEGYDLVSLMVRLHCRGFWERLLSRPSSSFSSSSIRRAGWPTRLAAPRRRRAAAC